MFLPAGKSFFSPADFMFQDVELMFQDVELVFQDVEDRLLRGGKTFSSGEAEKNARFVAILEFSSYLCPQINLKYQYEL